MTLMEILSTLLIGPLKLIFEFIFVFAYKFVGNYGLSVVVLSLVMNFLLLPLYKRTDAIQEQARDTEEKLRRGVEHIKKSFSGDERMMILQTYYRQNNYKPTDALNGSVSLLLEVPFFMAAYQFLSNLALLEGISFGPIADLSAPDGLLVIGGMTLNLLPVVMTVVNFVSSAMYLKGFPLKTKIQLYAMAVFFLVFLYESPSGLVMYWTMNNLFSLVKTLFYKLKNPRKAAAICASAAGIALLCYGLAGYRGDSLKVKAVLLGMGVLLQLPVVLMMLGSRVRLQMPKVTAKPDRKQFLLGALFLTILTGLLIPSTFIAASPQEYVDITYFHNPLWYCVSAGALAAGTFLVWMGVFYWLANDSGKAIFDKLVWILSGVMIVNYMFFGNDLGVISANLKYENPMIFSRTEQMMNLLVLVVAVVCLYLIAAKWSKTVTTVLLTAAIALGSMSVMNIAKINTSLQNLGELNAMRGKAEPHFELSKTGNNVVVIMLDRAMGNYIPYLFQEKPELEAQFDGFTYYANTISHGGCTNFGIPGLMGGYEYTPVEMNKRADERLVDKHNEALKVMPVLFRDNGYKVTVCDAPYANYQWIPDMSIYNDYPEINTFITDGYFSDPESKQAEIETNHRNFFCFSIMKTMPLAAQPTIYNDGRYNRTGAKRNTEEIETTQTQNGLAVAQGLFSYFMEGFQVLENLPVMSYITETGSDTFLFLSNNTTHEPMLLQTPDYIPAASVDNTEYDALHADRFTVDGKTMKVDNANQMIHYHANMAAMLQLGNWFDYLRENGVYDNTRIILVSDHGRALYHFDELAMPEMKDDIECYYPLLMVKDFNSKGFTTTKEFMTNADVPTLAMEQLIENPVNPFTGKTINMDEKFAHDQMVICSSAWEVNVNNGNTFLPSTWASVKDDVWNKNNWTFSDVETVLAEYKLP